MSRLVCWVFGHRPHRHMRFSTAVTFQCTRCRRWFRGGFMARAK